MPKSRVRQKTVYTPPPPKTAARKVSPKWVPIGFVGSILLGLAWILVYYIDNGQFPGQSALGGWNLVIGFVLMIAGLGLATQWH